MIRVASTDAIWYCPVCQAKNKDKLKLPFPECQIHAELVPMSWSSTPLPPEPKYVRAKKLSDYLDAALQNNYMNRAIKARTIITR